MKAETLKKSILQYAMQGKLVAQDPNDEPASELLKRIKAEKEQLIKDGKIKKEKPLPPITEDEIPYELPHGWEWVRLGEISKIVTKGTTPRGGNVAYLDSGVGFLRAENISGKYFIDTKTLKYIDHETHIGYLKRSIIEQGDILITIAGTLGRTSFVREEDLPLNANQAVSIVRLVNNNFIDLKYIVNAISSPDTQKRLIDLKRITAIPNLTLEIISNLLIPLPPLAEQQRIVEKLEEILPLVEEYGKNEEILSEMNKKLPKQIRSSILQYAVQGKLVEQDPNDEPASELLKRIKAEKKQLIKDGKIKKEKPLPPITEDEIPYKLPQGWEWCRVNDIGVYKKGPFGSALTKKIFVPKGTDTVKVYEQKNAIQKDCSLGEYYISKEYYEKSMKSFTVSSGDVIVSCAGTIGETYIMPRDIELGIINQALMRMTITKEIDLKYFLMYFDIILKRDSKTYSKGSVIKNIPPFEIFKPMLIPLPPLAEQQRIVEKVEELMKIVDELENKEK